MRALPRPAYRTRSSANRQRNRITVAARGKVARVQATALSRLAGASATGAGTSRAGARGHAASSAPAPM